MTLSERERRIEAGMRAWLPLGSALPDRRIVAAILDAADVAVPMVSAEVYALVLGECQKERQSAEAAARNLAKAVRRYLTLPYERLRRDEDEFARRVLDRHPSFSGEEGTAG